MPSIQIPHMTPFPGKRSVLIMDNASIHHCLELLPLVNTAGGILLYTPPYCFDCTPLDNGAFGWVKRYLQQHDLLFRTVDMDGRWHWTKPSADCAHGTRAHFSVNVDTWVTRKSCENRNGLRVRNNM